MKLNNKGFTLVEVVACLAIIGFIFVLVVSISGNTFSVNKNKAYDIMKNNIIKASSDYINECDSDILECNLIWNENKTEININSLKESGYFKNFISPIDGRNVSNCLKIIAIKKNGNIDIELIDNCY